MTKERVEELIKQRGTIWRISSIWRKCLIDNIFPVKLDERNSCISMPDMHLWVGNDRFDINTLFETKEQAEWAYKTIIERTERFEPPIWEDLPIKWDFYFVKDKHMFHFGYENYNGDKRVIVSKCEYACEYGSDGYYVIYEKFGNATKENYEKACEIVRDLFKGKNE